MDNLQNGITAFKSGKREDARKYLIAAVKENPKDENAWGWLYQVANNDNERIECLKKVTAINPNNEKAKQLLNQLLAPPLTPTPAMTNPPPLAPSPAVAIPPQQRQVNSPIAEQKKSNNVLWLVIAVISALSILCCILLFASSGSGSTNIKVKYVVTGSASSAFVTYFNEQGGTEQVDSYLPFEKDLSVSFGAPLSLVAQNSGSGSLTCEIWINGEKVKTSTTTADYGVVTCSDFAK